MASSTTVTDSKYEFDTKLVNESEFPLESPGDKLRLQGRYWPCSKENPQVMILFAHGSGEHCQRYRHVAHFFNSKGISCVSYDTRGHGLSDGERGFAPNLDAYFDDIECAVSYIRTTLKFTNKLIIYAHGTGCSICIGHLLRRPKPLDYQGLILSTPSICLKQRPNPILFFVARSIAKMSPHLRMPVQGNYENTYTSDPDMVKRYRQDALVHDRWPARSLCLYLELGYQLEKQIVEFSVPVLIQHGADDIVTPVAKIENWRNTRVKGKDIHFKSWPGHLHELHNDLGREDIFNFVFNWINTRFNAPSN